MGGGGKKQTEGYKYSIGAHMVLIQGIADRLTRIRVGGKNAWSGGSTGGRININAPSLFGGEKREGGIVGAVDFETGGATQPRNDYLQARLGASLPAFRGVTAAVLRQVYIGLNPYLKAWAFRIQRIHKRQDGATQWYDAKAAIGTQWSVPQAFYFALDTSNSMNTITSNGLFRLTNAKAALLIALDRIMELKAASGDVRVDIMVVAWGGEPGNHYARSTNTKRNVTAADITALKAWVWNLNAPGSYGTFFPCAVVDAKPYFDASLSNAQRTMFFITDGQPQIPSVPDSENSPEARAYATEAANTVAAIPDLAVYGINVDLTDTTETAKLDNTPIDGVPVVAGDDSQALANVINFASEYGHQDMNPAHIIRECLTDRHWGMGYQEADIDDASFVAAADRLYAESMGISILWDRQSDIQAFVDEIVRHIDAALYVSRTTGKFVLKLIRDDYDIETIPTLDESVIESVEDYSRPAWGELINSVTVNYWSHETGKAASLTCDDPAAVQLHGVVNNTTIEYPGFSNGYIAARVAARDLRALSTPLLSCTIYANRTAAVLNIGDVFRFEWPDYHDGAIVMRVTGIALGDGRNNKVRIQCAQDVFALPEAATIVQPPSVGQERYPAAAATRRLAAEVPYFEACQRFGQRFVDDALAQSPLIGYVMASASRPDDNATSAEMYTDAGAGYDGVGPLDFAPAAELSAAIGKTATSLPITGATDLEQLRIGSLVAVGGEIMRVDAVGANTLTVGRGCLDTVPTAHAAGTSIIGYDDYAELDSTEYAAGESIGVKLVTITPREVLAISSAPADTVTLSQRAVRPYAPGKMQINGIAYPATIGDSEDLSITWSHRDRQQQTGAVVVDTTAASIGPESGTTYTVRLYDELDVLGHTEAGITGTEFTFTTAEEIAAMGRPGNLAWLRLETGFGANAGRALTYANGLWVMVGDGGKIATSPDRVTWTLKNSGVTVALEDVAFGNGVWVAVGASGTILTSSDTDTWTARTNPFGTQRIYGVIYANSTWVAVGALALLCTSADTVTWTSRTSNAGSFRDILAIAHGPAPGYGGNRFIATTINRAIIVSSDAVSWSNYGTGLPYLGYRCINCNGTTWVMGGQQGEIRTSADGFSWTRRTSDFGADWDVEAVIPIGSSEWIAVGRATNAAGVGVPAKIARSLDDGATWTMQPAVDGFNSATVANDLYDVASDGAGSIIVVGISTEAPASSAAGLVQSPPRVNNTLRIELEAMRDGLVSWQMHNHTLTRA